MDAHTPPPSQQNPPGESWGPIIGIIIIVALIFCAGIYFYLKSDELQNPGQAAVGAVRV